MTITISAIETTIEDVWHAALVRAGAAVTAVSKGITVVDNAAVDIASLALPILQLVAPQDAAAVNVVLAAIKLLDNLASETSIVVSGVVTASGTSLSAELKAAIAAVPGFSALISNFSAAKAQLLKYEASL